MKISIVMLAYNHQRFIEQALESVLMQETGYEYELIVGEDCSRDCTREIVKKFEERFHGRMRPLYRDKNLGMIKNLLDCLEHCKGEYIAMLEGDDFWTDSSKLQKQVDFLDKHSEYIACVHNWNIVGADNTFLRKGFETDYAYDYAVEDMETFALPAQTSTLIFRNIFQEVKEKYYRTLVHFLWIPMDTIAVLLMLQYGKIHVLPQAMSTYRYYIEENGSNWSSAHEVESKENYLYFFIMALGLERLSRKIGSPISMIDEKVRLFRESRKARGWSKRRKWLWLQGILMILTEPHRIIFLKKIQEDRKKKAK